MASTVIGGFFQRAGPLSERVSQIVDTRSVEQEETPLAGGNLSVVVRVGDTVRRSLHPWSEAVQGLLRHLEAQGFDGAPRFLGIDDQGREILTFIAGEVGAYPLPASMWSDEALTGAAQLLAASARRHARLCRPGRGGVAICLS
jgi:hypothetical protein